MKVSLKTRTTLIATTAIIVIGMITTTLFILNQRRHIDREAIARGTALAETLARALDEGIASENLNIMRTLQDIVHTDDVVLVQAYSTLWLGLASIPPAQLTMQPDPSASDYFKDHRSAPDRFIVRNINSIDIYHSVFLDTHDVRIKPFLVGFVRLRMSTEAAGRELRNTVLANLAAATLLTIAAAVAMNLFIGRYLLAPLLLLHRSVVSHKKGEFATAIPVQSDDELGELIREFNAMTAAVKEREDRLAEERERLLVTLRSIGDAVIVTDLSGTVTLFNRIAEQHTGWTSQEAIGRKLPEVFNIVMEKTGAPCENPVDKVVRSGLTCGLANHTALIRKDGTRISIEDSAAPIRDRGSRTIGVVLVFRDVTERQKMEEEMLKIEKLESVGLLAGGLAHDFNNLLTSIVGNISLAKMYVDPRNKAFARLSEAETASRRATDLTYQLLTFSRGGAPVKKVMSIVDIIQEAAGFALSGTNVACKFDFAKDLWPAEVDPGQMNQVFNNLIINAVQAMPGGGSILFRAVRAVLGEQEVPSLHAGPYIKVSVQDTGTGIPKEHVSRIFDPYFTTKQKGSGLGLTSTFSIVKRHDGHMTVESNPLQGTIFHIYLPARTDAAVAATGTVHAIEPGQGKILVMDDEAIIRDVAGEMLRTLGYQVEFAPDGNAAFELYRAARESNTPFSCVITDLTIPGGMGGKDLIRKLIELDPDVRAIVSSGYSNDPIMSEYRSHGFKGVITKPYTIEAFSKALDMAIKA